MHALTYQRPAYYVLQGWLWAAFGFHESLGRGLALAFAVLLAWSLARIARGLVPDAGPARAAALLPLVVPEFAMNCASGTTDVPAAALVAATAAVLVWEGRGVLRLPLLVALSAAAALTKPTAILSLAGLAAASVLVKPASDSRRRPLAPGAAAILAGLGLAGCYFAWLAARLGTDVKTIVVGALEGYYAELAAGARGSALFLPSWLGPAAGPLLAAALVAIFLGTGGRRAAGLAIPFGVSAAFVFAAWLFSPARPSDPGGRPTLISLATLALAAGALVGVRAAPPPRAPALFLAVWATPPLLTWIVSLGYDRRLLSPAWPPLLLLAWLALAPAVVAIRERRGRLLAIAAGTLVAAVSLRQLDGISFESARCLARSALGSVVDRRECLVPGFERERRAVESVRLQSGRSAIISNDGRLRFFFPGDVAQLYPASCAELSGYGTFALLTSPSALEYMASRGIPSTPEAWSACEAPRLRLAFRDSTVAVFEISP